MAKATRAAFGPTLLELVDEGIDVIDPNLDPDVLDEESELLAERSEDETDAAEVTAMHVIPDDRSN